MNKNERGEVVTFPAPCTAERSDVYTVTVDGKEVFVERFYDIDYAHFAFSGEVEVTVCIPASIGHRNLHYIHDYSIRPTRAATQAKAKLNALTLRISEPKKLVIQINEYKRIFLFADPIYEDTPKPGDKGVVNFADFAVDGEGKAVQTENIAGAIEETPEGGVLYFPPGVYLTGTFHLKSDMTLYLAGGAVIKASDDPADFPADESSPHMYCQGFMVAPGAKNLRIAGYGVIDGNGAIVRAQQCGPHLALVYDCEDVEIEGIFVRDPAAWNTHILNSDNVTMRSIKMLNNRNVLNTDGFDISSSRSVLLEDSFNYCSDDSAVIKSYGDNEGRDITIRNNVFLTKKSALKVGTEGEANISNVTFIGNDVVECDRGMTLAMEDGSVYSNIRYIDNRFELISIDARQRLIDFYIWDRKGGGRIENVLIKGCEADVYWPLPSTMIGYDEESFIKGVRIENLKIAGEVCESLEEANITIDVMPYWDVRRPHVYEVTIESAPENREE